MARKVCPTCKKLNGASAVVCDCGHTFPESSIVAAIQTTKKCPSCRTVQPLLLEVCACGHKFADIVELRAELVGRVHVAWSYILLGLVILGACVGIAMATSGMWIIGLSGGVILALRGLMLRADARSALREIDDATGTLPNAKVQRVGPR